MTPLQIEIMLHYYSHGGDFRNRDFSSPSVHEAVDFFLGIEMLAKTDFDAATKPYLRITPKGTVFVDALCAVPLPVKQWVIPGHNGGAT